MLGVMAFIQVLRGLWRPLVLCNGALVLVLWTVFLIGFESHRPMVIRGSGISEILTTGDSLNESSVTENLAASMLNTTTRALYISPSIKRGENWGNSSAETSEVSNASKTTPTPEFSFADVCSMRGYRSRKRITAESRSVFQNVSYYDTKTVRLTYRVMVANVRRDCTVVGISRQPMPPTALASIPGSGNTWARHLIQLITGVYTGSVYQDQILWQAFPGEGHINSDFIAIKTHEGWKSNTRVRYTRVILLVRPLMDTLRAEFRRQNSPGLNHTGGPIRVSNQDRGHFLQITLDRYLGYNSYWISRALSKRLDLFLLFFDDLVLDIRRALTRLAYFLGVNLSQQHLQCALENEEGKFHRKKENLVYEDPFRDFSVNHTQIDEDQTHLRLLIRECLVKKACMTSGCGFMYI